MVELLAEGLDLNQSLIDSDQVELQNQLSSKFREFKKELQKYVPAIKEANEFGRRSLRGRLPVAPPSAAQGLALRRSSSVFTFLSDHA